jgi:replicative DNA helicase
MVNQKNLTDKLPPQNIEAEQSVLGCLMLDKNAVVRVADVLRPGDFYRQIHNTIFDAMFDLYEKGEPIDLLSLTNRLEDLGKLEEIGGPAYLTDLVNRVPTAAHVLHYAKIVHHKKVLRDLIEAAEHIALLGFKEEENIENLLDEAEQMVFRISQKNLSQEFLPVKSTLEEAFERIDKLHKGDGALRGVPTGFYDLDNYLSGLQKSDLIILAARPSLGKTAMALDIARYVAIKGKIPVGIFSLEMSKHDVVDRLLAAQAGIDLWKLRTGRLSMDGLDNDLIRIQEAMAILSEAPIFIDDAPSPTVLQMRTMGRRLQAEHDLGLIIVDYLQLIQPRTASESMVQQVTEISRALKGLARELECPVLAISQLSRAVEGRPDQMPRLADLRESGSIEQDADVVMFIYREDKTKKDSARPNIADIIIAKHRNGPIGKTELYFNESQVSFKNLERHFAE